MSTLNTTNLKNPSSGSNNIVLGTDGTTTVPTLSSTTITGTTIQGTIKSGTAVASTSGTAIDFTGIPSWVKRITVMFSGVSTNGTSNLQVQLGDAGGIETTGYVAAIADAGSISSLYTTGFPCTFSLAAAAFVSGSVTISKVTGNTWVAGILTMRHDPSPYHGAGSKTLSDTLTQLRITTVNGTDTFDAGTINILFEG
jgi:hypothetical protein